MYLGNAIVIRILELVQKKFVIHFFWIVSILLRVSHDYSYGENNII
jgi:hypothetical protein